MTNQSTEQTEQVRRTGRPRKNQPEIEPIKKIDEEALKSDLRRYLDEKLDERFIDRLDDMNKKLLREKSRKILARNIFILLLLVLVGFESFALYERGFFDSILNREKTEEIKNANASSENSSEKSPSFSVSVEEKTPSLDELKEKYASLLDSFKISKTSAYLSDFNSGTLSNELKLYFALNSLSFNDLEVEEDYNLVSEEKIKSAAEKLFSSPDLKLTSFDFNGNKLRYFEKLNSLVSSELLKKSDNLIDFEIFEIKEESDSKVIIKTVSNLVFTFKDKKLVSLSKTN